STCSSASRPSASRSGSCSASSAVPSSARRARRCAPAPPPPPHPPALPRDFPFLPRDLLVSRGGRGADGPVADVDAGVRGRRPPGAAEGWGAGGPVGDRAMRPDGRRLIPPPSPTGCQPAERLWPLTNEPVANQHVANLDALEGVLAARCRTLLAQPETIRAQ